MSLSRNHDIFNSKFMILSIVIFTIFTVSLTENLQTAEGLTVTLSQLNYELNAGDTQMITWTVNNSEDIPINVEFYAEGEGSELLVFEEFASLEPRKSKVLEVFVVVPETVDDVEYRPTLYVIQKGTIEEGKSGLIINIRLQTPITIKIGDNPIYTPPVEKIEPKIPVAPKVIEPEVEVEVEKSKELTAAEKIALIQAANEAKQVTPQVSVTQTPEVKDESFIPEPVMEKEPVADNGGGCLIATATFGSELAPQVQLLREIRDNKLSNTESGLAFMAGFNQLYYSFSPYIADMQRENPAFKEAVKIGITPLLSSLSIMEYAESDSEVLGYGIAVILLNIGMYVGIPAFGIVKVFQIKRK